MSNANSSFINILKGVLLTAFGIVVVLTLQHFVFRLKPEPKASNQEIEKRIKPLASVVITPLPETKPQPISTTTGQVTVASDNKETSPNGKKETLASNNSALGKKTFESICTGCHSSGALGAPKFGNKKDWAPRIAQGINVLYHSALNGKNSMPAKGGNPALTDSEVKAAVDYMVAAAK